MKNIIIFGGAGFIGVNLTKYFLENNNKVLCFDNLSTSDISNTELFNDNPNYKFVKVDIVDCFEDGTIFRETDEFFGPGFPVKANVDEIYNLACPASPPKYLTALLDSQEVF